MTTSVELALVNITPCFQVPDAYGVKLSNPESCVRKWDGEILPVALTITQFNINCMGGCGTQLENVVDEVIGVNHDSCGVKEKGCRGMDHAVRVPCFPFLLKVLYSFQPLLVGIRLPGS